MCKQFDRYRGYREREGGKGERETLPKEFKSRVGRRTNWIIFLKWDFSAAQREAQRKGP